jgi:hypothetical protein
VTAARDAGNNRIVESVVVCGVHARDSSQSMKLVEGQLPASKNVKMEAEDRHCWDMAMIGEDSRLIRFSLCWSEIQSVYL